jgi:hypothetical protein
MTGGQNVREIFYESCQFQAPAACRPRSPEACRAVASCEGGRLLGLYYVAIAILNALRLIKNSPSRIYTCRIDSQSSHSPILTPTKPPRLSPKTFTG